ncbi:MAG: hypothetical protein Q8O83_04285 [bacterium]|nr:hypothetical protein [bacterium]
MLPSNAWKNREPRFGFPTFKGIDNLVSFSVRPDFVPVDFVKMKREGFGALMHGPRALGGFLKVNVPLLLFSRDQNLRFKLIVTSRNGEYCGTKKIAGVYPPGGSIDVNVTEVIKDMGLPDDDYMAILVMSNGRHDGVRSSPGSYSMTYSGKNFYSTYRTGGFIRTLNDPRKKSHFGFRGINPTVIANKDTLSSLFLINHSSWPGYNDVANPRTVLLRADGKTREARFGEIHPFGGVEKSMEELFGKDVHEFLAPFGGKGTTITTCPGVTLASIHITRARDGSSFSIEHSRPTHTYLLAGVAGTIYKK